MHLNITSIEDSSETVTITKKEYLSMRRNELLLLAARNQDVDNWDGWEIAIDTYHKYLEAEGIEE